MAFNVNQQSFVFNTNDPALAENTYVNSDQNTAIPQVRSGNNITFNSNATYGTATSPITGNIALNSSDLVIGTNILIIHNASSEPTYPTAFDKSVTSADYVPNVINYIFCEVISSTIIIYSITQTL
jgi:hypothetical protein